MRTLGPVAVGRGTLVSVTTAMLLGSCGGNGEGGAAPESTPQATTATQERVLVELTPENGSRVRGTALLRTTSEGHLEVGLELTVPPALAKDALPAHIHEVSCAEYRKLEGFDAQLASVTDHLPSVRDGVATSTAASTLQTLTRGGFSINVHRPAHPFPSVACGDIPER